MPINVKEVKVGTSGKTIVVLFQDAVGADTYPTTLNSSPSIKINGGNALTLNNPLFGESLNYAMFALPSGTIISPTDTVTFSANNAWMTTAAGSVQMSVDVAVSNKVGVPLVPTFVQGIKTMNIGMNILNPTYYSVSYLYSNLFRHSTGWQGTCTIDPVTGEIVSSSGVIKTNITASNLDNGYDAKGYPASPPGDWTLMWDGADVVSLLNSGPGNGTLTTKTTQLTGGTDNKIVYTLSFAPSDTYCASLQCSISKSNPDVKNIRVYPPGEPIDGSNRFHANLIDRVGNLRSLRFMDLTNTNSSNIINYDEDWVKLENIRVYSRKPDVVANVTWHAPFDNSMVIMESANGWVAVEFTTSAPHGFKTGQTATFSGITLTFADDSTKSLNGYTPSCVYVSAPNKFAISVYTGNSGNIVKDKSATGTASIAMTAVLPLEDLCDMCNVTDTDMWICMPHLIDNQSVSKMAGIIADRLDASHHVRVEYSNECWNYAASFQQYNYMRIMAATTGVLPKQFYAKRACEIHDIFQGVFEAKGRPNSLIRIIAAQAGAVAQTTSVIAPWMLANGKKVDEWAVAPYYVAGPATYLSTWDMMDVDQHLDANELYLMYGKSYVSRCMEQHKAVLQNYYPDVSICAYEGATELGSRATNSVVKWRMGRQWTRHPRFLDFIRFWFQNWQDQGCVNFQWFTLSMPLYTGYLWTVYIGTSQQAGKGDGSDGKFNNLTNIEDLRSIVSVLGYGINEWSSFTYSTKFNVDLSVERIRVGQPMVITITPTTQLTDTFYFADDRGGVFSPTKLEYNGESTPKSVTYYPTHVGGVQIKVSPSNEAESKTSNTIESYVEDSLVNVFPVYTFRVKRRSIDPTPLKVNTELYKVATYSIDEYNGVLFEGDTFTLRGIVASRCKVNVELGFYDFLEYVPT